ncbi:MAG: protein kinase [Myxococcota bacterium]
MTEVDPHPTWPQRVRLFIQLGRGMATAHAAGLVHRDFKPANAIDDDDGHVRVLDFGLVRQTNTQDTALAEPLSGAPPKVQGQSRPAPLTRSGASVRTPTYMAPEQLKG